MKHIEIELKRLDNEGRRWQIISDDKIERISQLCFDDVPPRKLCTERNYGVEICFEFVDEKPLPEKRYFYNSVKRDSFVMYCHIVGVPVLHVWTEMKGNKKSTFVPVDYGQELEREVRPKIIEEKKRLEKQSKFRNKLDNLDHKHIMTEEGEQSIERDLEGNWYFHGDENKDELPGFRRNLLEKSYPLSDLKELIKEDEKRRKANIKTDCSDYMFVSFEKHCPKCNTEVINPVRELIELDGAHDYGKVEELCPNCLFFVEFRNVYENEYGNVIYQKRRK